MDEKAGGAAGAGEKVGGIYYEVTLDTQKLIDGQRQVVSAVDKVGAKLTETATAAKAYSHEAGMASNYTKEFEAQAKKLGMTVGELKAATRGLPAQFTDIATSLASGQNPLTVFLQQGGQLKDMFGGIGPAFRAMAGYIAGLVNPFTVAAAAAGVFIYALVKGGQEFQNFNRTLELSGFRAGVTAEHLIGLAGAMDSMAGVTQGQAAEALNTFISLGVKGSDGLRKFSEAAIELERVGGPAVAETAKAFADLEKNPLEASIKLQDSTGFLTDEIYRQIKALEESGNKTEAARVAQEAYSNAINDRTPKIAEQLGYLERLWQGITRVTREAGDALLEVGRSTNKKRLDSLVSQRDFAINSGSGDATINSLDAQIAAVEKLLDADNARANQQAAATNAADAAIAQDKTRAQWADRYASNQERARKEIEKARKDGVLTPELEARINDRYKDKSASGARKTRFSPDAYIEDLKGKAAPTETGRVNSEADEALSRNRKMLADGLLTKEQAAQAEVLIDQRKQNALAAIAEKTTERTTALRLALMQEGEEKIEAVRLESLRKIDAAEKDGSLTAEQAALSRQQAEQVAANARADLAERDARAAAAVKIAIATDEESKIKLIRDEAIRQAQAGYQRGTLTAAEEAAKRVEAERAAQAQIKQNRDALVKAVNPADALRQEYEAKLSIVQTYENLMAQAGVDATLQAQMTRTQITTEYEAQRRALAEQTFRSQGESQAFLLDSLNSLSQTATSSILGLINGTMTAQDAMRSLAGTVLNEAVSALVKIGMQQIKNALLADTLAAADKARMAANGALYTASVSAQVAGMTAMAAQNAFAATAAIPIVGPALAPAAAAAAGSMAAALGAPAIATAPIAGGRLYGGPVSDDKMYRVNENGRPEMFTASNGQQYMLPNARGEVTPANELGGGKVQISVQINNNHSGAAVSVQQDDSGRVVQIAINEVASQISNNAGPVWQAMRGSTNIEGRI